MQKGELDVLSVDDMAKIIEESEKAYDKIFPTIEKEVKSL